MGQRLMLPPLGCLISIITRKAYLLRTLKMPITNVDLFADKERFTIKLSYVNVQMGNSLLPFLSTLPIVL